MWAPFRNCILLDVFSSGVEASGAKHISSHLILRLRVSCSHKKVKLWTDRRWKMIHSLSAGGQKFAAPDFPNKANSRDGIRHLGWEKVGYSMSGNTHDHRATLGLYWVQRPSCPCFAVFPRELDRKRISMLYKKDQDTCTWDPSTQIDMKIPSLCIKLATTLSNVLPYSKGGLSASTRTHMTNWALACTVKNSIESSRFHLIKLERSLTTRFYSHRINQPTHSPSRRTSHNLWSKPPPKYDERILPIITARGVAAAAAATPGAGWKLEGSPFGRM